MYPLYITSGEPLKSVSIRLQGHCRYFIDKYIEGSMWGFMGFRCLLELLYIANLNSVFRDISRKWK